MFSQVSYCKQDKEQSRASKEQYENAENKTNHMKTPRHVFKEENPITRGKKKKKILSVNPSSKNFTSMNSCKTWVTINPSSLYLPM